MIIKQVFISAPFRAKTMWDVARSCNYVESVAADVIKLNEELRPLGISINYIAAHLNARNFAGLAPDDFWLEVYLDLLKRCDAMLLTGEWEGSDGCLLELGAAQALEKPVFHTLEGLRAWALEAISTKENT